jgi:hypothetical protein
MSSLFDGGDDYDPPPEPPAIDHASIQAASDAARRRQRTARGQGSTMLTSGLGVVGDANVGTARLLGR